MKAVGFPTFISRCCKLPNMNFFKHIINFKSYQESIPSQSFHHQPRQCEWNHLLSISTWFYASWLEKWLVVTSRHFYFDLTISMIWLLQPYDMTQLTWVDLQIKVTWLDLQMKVTWLADENDLTWLGDSSGEWCMPALLSQVHHHIKHVLSCMMLSCCLARLFSLALKALVNF